MLINLVEKHARINWSLFSKSMPGRSAQSCRKRWFAAKFLNRPFTPKEDEIIIRAHVSIGNDWATIGSLLCGRTDLYVIMNHWDSTLRWKTSSMTNKDLTLGAHNIYIPPPSLSDIGRGQGSSYIHDGNLSHEVAGVSGQAPSIGDMARDNVSQPSGGMHPYSGEQSAPSRDAFNKRDSSTMMIDSDNVQELVGDEFGWNDSSEVSSKKYQKIVVTNDN